MKKIFYFLTMIFLFGLVSCKSDSKNKSSKVYASFGEKISLDNAITNSQLAEKYKTMKVGDTISVKFTSTIDQVCQKKGCWIKVPLDANKQSFVKFKDYGFFMPLNSAGNEVVLNGKAFISKVSIEDLRHYAKDAGKSDEEIAAIKTPKIIYSFLADGVLLEAKSDEKN